MFIKKFDQDGKGYVIKGEAVAAVNDQAEMIRTVDMVNDILMQFPSVNNFVNKYKRGIDNVVGKINGG